MLVGIFPLQGNTEECPPLLNLCEILKTFFSNDNISQTDYRLLVELANRENLSHITSCVVEKLRDEEAIIIYAYLKRHPEHIEELMKAIPSSKVRVLGAIYDMVGYKVLGGPRLINMAKYYTIDNLKALEDAGRSVMDG